jgi:hypothetical protein
MKDGKWPLKAVISVALPVAQLFGKAPSVLKLSDADLKDALSRAGFELIETLTQTGAIPRIFTVARKP